MGIGKTGRGEGVIEMAKYTVSRMDGNTRLGAAKVKESRTVSEADVNRTRAAMRAAIPANSSDWIEARKA